MLLALLLFLACADDIAITPSQAGCDATELDADSTVEWELGADGSARVWRTNAVQDQTGLIFDPVIAVDGKVVEVYEVWTGGESPDTFCYEPVLSLEGVGRKLQIRWFLAEGETVPFDTVDLEAP